MELSTNDALALAKKVAVKAGIPEKDASTVADHLIAAELRGYPGHGLKRLIGIHSNKGNYGTESANTIAVSKPGFTHFDGAGRIGIAALSDAMDHCATIAKTSGAVVFGLTGFIGTTGSLSIYSSKLAESGMVSIAMCHSEFAVAPFGASRAILGTNPISIGFPSENFPFTADFATAAWSYGKIMDSVAAGEQIPEGIVQSSDGKPSTDPNDANNGSQLPMAEHKGYALGLSIELICGALLGAKLGRDAVPGGDGAFGIVVNSSVARDTKAVAHDATKLFAEIINAPVAHNGPPRIPGERSALAKSANRSISLPLELHDQLVGLCD